jgi:hypothetical protein
MASLRGPLVALALVSLVPVTALAQQQPPQDPDEIRIEENGATPSATPPTSDDSRARDGELVLVITELPGGAAQRPRPGNVPVYSPGMLRPLPPEPPDTPEQQRQAYSAGLVLGAALGVGGPGGVLSAFVEVAPVRGVAARVGAGVGINFGPSVEVGAIVRPWQFWRLAPLVSLTYSTNFTPESWRRLTGFQAPANSHWFTPGIGLELRLRPIIMLRLNFGVSVLMNTGEFSNVAANGWWGPARPPNSLGYSPLSAGDAHDEGRALVVPGVWFDLAALGPRW